MHLKYAPDAWVRKKMTINGLRMVHELRGIPCFAIDEEMEPNKSFVVSRSFGKAISEKKYLHQAVATHATSGARKLRKQGLLAGHISAFVIIRHHQDDTRYYESASVQLPMASSYTPDIISAAKACIDKIFKPGLIYKKAGIMLNDLSSSEHAQLHIEHAEKNGEKQKEWMHAVDRVTTKWGSDKLIFAASGTGDEQPWHTKKEKKSACFTTSWQELLTIDLEKAE